MGILSKHAKDNFFDARWKDFEAELDAGRISTKAIPGYFLIRTRCLDCDEDCNAIKYHGRRLLIIPNGEFWINHQCPPPVEDTHPDDPEVRDGSGNLRGGGWTDRGDDQDRRQFDDPKYSFDYPDIPYVDPTQNTRR